MSSGNPNVKRNLVWLAASQIATWSGSLVVVVIAPRHLSTDDFGAFQFAFAFVGYFMLIGMLGTSTYLVKTIARDDSAVGVYLVNALIMKLVLTCCLSTIAIGLAHALGHSGQTILLIEVSCASMVIFVMVDTLGAVLQGLERFGRFAVWRVVQTYVGGAIALYVLVGEKGVVAFALAGPLSGLVPLVANTVHVWPELRRSLRIDLRVWAQLARGGAPFLLWSAVLVVYGTIDIPILKAMAGNSEVGWYALAYAWVGMPAGFGSIVMAATMPSLSANAVRESTAEFVRLANRAICLVLFVALPSSIGIALVAGDVFALLHYQAGFDHAVPLVQILALHIPAIGMDMVLGSALIAADRQKQWTCIGCGAAVLNPVLNLAAIPVTIWAFDNGAIGAAVVTVVTEVFMMIGALAMRPRGVMDRATVSFALRCVVASAVMVPTVLAAGAVALPVKIAIGVVVYGIASLGVGTVSLDGFRGWTTGDVGLGRFLKTVTVPE